MIQYRCDMCGEIVNIRHLFDIDISRHVDNAYNKTTYNICKKCIRSFFNKAYILKQYKKGGDRR